MGRAPPPHHHCNISTWILNTSSSNFYFCPLQFSWRLKQMEFSDWLQWMNRFEGGRRRNISSQTIAPPLQKWWPSTAWQRSRKPRGQIHFRNHHGKSCWLCARTARDRLDYWTPPYSHNRDHTMASRPILCPAVKMKPYSALCRPSVSLLKPKNKDWVE